MWITAINYASPSHIYYAKPLGTDDTLRSAAPPCIWSLILRNTAVEMEFANGKSTQSQSWKSKMTFFVGFKMRNPLLLHGKVKIKVIGNQ